ncbi:hypothetical protein AB0F24_17510 [Streptomyces platensis]|uniref:hypothetical protein n=1 Tax=Streptomyces platensis TaxID=58346 RepID=UPI0033E101BC
MSEMRYRYQVRGAAKDDSSFFGAEVPFNGQEDELFRWGVDDLSGQPELVVEAWDVHAALNTYRRLWQERVARG